MVSTLGGTEQAVTRKFAGPVELDPFIADGRPGLGSAWWSSGGRLPNRQPADSLQSPRLG